MAAVRQGRDCVNKMCNVTDTLLCSKSNTWRLMPVAHAPPCCLLLALCMVCIAPAGAPHIICASPSSKLHVLTWQGSSLAA